MSFCPCLTYFVFTVQGTAQFELLSSFYDCFNQFPPYFFSVFWRSLYLKLIVYVRNESVRYVTEFVSCNY